MRFLTTFCAALIFLAGLASAVYAANVNRVVPAGKTSLIFVFYNYNPETCYTSVSSKPKLRKPAHGTLTAKLTPFRVQKGKECAGRKVNAVSVFYTPDRGYRGRDKAKFGFSFPRYVDDTGYGYYGVTANISVK